MQNNGRIDPTDHSLTGDRARDADLVTRIRAGDDAAFGALYDAWFDRVWNVAFRIVHDHGLASDVAQDAFLAAWRKLDTLADPASFGGWILRIARNGALNRIAKESRSSAVDAEGLAMIERHDVAAGAGTAVRDRAAHLADPALVAGDTELVGLVREVAASLGERDAEVLDLTLRYQLTPAEVGEVLGMNRNAANQLCHRVRGRFATAFGARMLVDDTGARCPDLQRELDAAGVVGFGPETVRIADRHAGTCERCGEDRRTRLAPGALFAAVPLVPVMLATRTRVAHALAAQGVPMHGSTAWTGGTDAGTGGTPAADAPVTTAVDTPTVPAGATVAATSARRSNTVVVLALVAAMVVIGAVWVATATRRPSPTATVTPATSIASTTTTDPTPTTPPPSTAIVEPPEATTVPAPTAPPTTVPVVPPVPATDPPQQTTTTSTTLPVSFGSFTLGGSTQVPSGWTANSGPTATWSTTGASRVQLRILRDNGDATVEVGRITVPSSGTSVPLCPAGWTGQGTCAAPPGHYIYELVATRADGSTVTGPDRIGFWVTP